MEKTPLETQKEQISALQKLLYRDKEATLRSMSPERRALYEKTLALRTRIGKGKFDVINAIRELRGYRDESTGH